MKRYRFNLSETNFIELSEEEFDSKETKNIDTGNSIISCKVLIVKYSDLKNEYYVIAPIDQFEVIET